MRGFRLNFIQKYFQNFSHFLIFTYENPLLAQKDLKSVTKNSFDEKVLRNAERAIEVQKLKNKLSKYK